MRRKRLVLFDTLRKNQTAILLFAVMTLLNGGIFYLYNIMTEGFVYSEILLFVMLFVMLCLDYFSELKKARMREHAKSSILIADFTAVESGCLADGDYGEMIALLRREIRRLQSEFVRRQQADDDYYTTWVHQIKTPIAVMKLALSEDTEHNRAMLAELFRIEQYVDMVLSYVRLKSNSADLVIMEYPVDDIIRETIRKFAPQFVLRKLKLCYEPTDSTVIADKKWLSFILEQVVSNAIKYTPQGEITIKAQGNKISISDTGMGINPEDLPRIFEKGYTGVNGRLGQASSGLGLFLTKKAADLLAITVTAESIPGKGSTFTMILPEK